MRRMTILAFSAGLLMACGSGGGGGEGRAPAGAGDPGQAEARSGTAGRPGAEAVPFGPRETDGTTQEG